MSRDPVTDPDDDHVAAAAAWRIRLSEEALTSAQRAALERWLAADPANRDAFDAVGEAWDEVEATAASPAMMALRSQAFDDLRRVQRARWMKGWSPLRRAAAAAAVLLVLAAAGFGLMLHLSPHTYQTAVGERRLIVFPDGSKASLDGATTVRVLYGRERRQFWLEHGRAKFDVAKDPLRPFTVGAGDKLVVATGTEFSVELLKRQVRVVLYEGHVAVMNRRGDKPAELVKVGGQYAEQLLSPGRELVASPEGVQVVATDPSRSLSWEAGQLIFDNEPLGSAVERVNRYAGAPLGVTGEAAAAVRISGVFTAGDTQAFVSGVTTVFPLRVSTLNGVQTLQLVETAQN
jgi:transmembrane sensor